MLGHLTVGISDNQPYNAQTILLAVIDEYDSNGKLPTDLSRATPKMVGSGASEHRTLDAGASVLQISNHIGELDFVVLDADFSVTIDFNAAARAETGFANVATNAAVIMAVARGETIVF